MTNHRLDSSSLQEGIDFLCQADKDLAFIVSTYGPSPLWDREPGFATLVRIILEQQVSLASAKAAFDRLQNRINPMSEKEFLKLTDAELKRIGFSRQKSAYCRNLAHAVIDGKVSLGDNGHSSDDQFRSDLLQLKGIGPWTTDIYFLMALRRPDIWPQNDLALAQAVQDLKQFHSRPDNNQLAKLSEAWRPWRAVAARLLWHYYLSKKNSK
jgi:DNA-3-methyladenine glycosylase II